jgi:hypothetical protein
VTARQWAVPRAEWPPLAEAQRIIDGDLRAMPEFPVCITIQQTNEGGWIGTMWQAGPNGSRSPQIEAIGQSQEDVVRHLAAIIARVRIGGV